MSKGWVNLETALATAARQGVPVAPAGSGSRWVPVDLDSVLPRLAPALGAAWAAAGVAGTVRVEYFVGPGQSMAARATCSQGATGHTCYIQAANDARRPSTLWQGAWRVCEVTGLQATCLGAPAKVRRHAGWDLAGWAATGVQRCLLQRGPARPGLDLKQVGETWLGLGDYILRLRKQPGISQARWWHLVAGAVDDPMVEAWSTRSAKLPGYMLLGHAHKALQSVHPLQQAKGLHAAWCAAQWAYGL